MESSGLALGRQYSALERILQGESGRVSRRMLRSLYGGFWGFRRGLSGIHADRLTYT